MSVLLRERASYTEQRPTSFSRASIAVFNMEISLRNVAVPSSDSLPADPGNSVAGAVGAAGKGLMESEPLAKADQSQRSYSSMSAHTMERGGGDVVQGRIFEGKEKSGVTQP